MNIAEIKLKYENDVLKYQLVPGAIYMSHWKTEYGGDLWYTEIILDIVKPAISGSVMRIRLHKMKYWYFYISTSSFIDYNGQTNM